MVSISQESWISEGDKHRNEPSPTLAAPLVYVTEPLVWAYRQLVRDLEREGPAGEEALNRLDEEGWELATVLVHAGRAHYYFKRPST